jgi:hypothetical protein
MFRRSPRDHPGPASTTIDYSSGLDEDAEKAGAAPFDKTTAEEIITRLAEIDAARQRAEATSRDSYVS